MATPESPPATPPPWNEWALGQTQAFLTTILGAVTSLGFVAFTGGLLLWARARALDLPATQVVAVAPKRELIAEGASALALFALVGVIAVGIVYLFDPYGRPTRRTRIGFLGLLTAELTVAMIYAKPNKEEAIWGGIWLAVAVVVLACFTLIDHFHEKAVDEPKPGNATQPSIRLSTGASIATLLVMVAATVLVWLVFRHWWVATCVAIAFGLFLVMVAVSRSSGLRFGGTAAAVLGSVVVFGAAASALRFWNGDSIQPVAALRASEADPVCGIYLVESDDRLYLARIDREPPPHVHGNASHIFWVSRKDTTGWAIGPPQSDEGAAEALSTLSDRVIAERRTRVTSSMTEKTTTTAPATTTTKPATTKKKASAPAPSTGEAGTTPDGTQTVDKTTINLTPDKPKRANGSSAGDEATTSPPCSIYSTP